MATILPEMIKVRWQWNNVFKVLKEKKKLPNLEFYLLLKYALIMKTVWRCYQVIQELRESVSSKSIFYRKKYIRKN